MTGTIYQNCPECGTDREQAVCVNCHLCPTHCTCQRTQQQAPAAAALTISWGKAYTNCSGQQVQFGEIIKNGFRSSVVARIIGGTWAVGKETMTYDNDAVGFRNSVMATGTASDMETARGEAEAYVATLS